MEAPERIYIHPTLDNLYGMGERSCESEIEYVRKDAFIESAVKWLKKELPITDLSPSNMLDISFKVFDKECKKEFIEKFKKYMKRK